MPDSYYPDETDTSSGPEQSDDIKSTSETFLSPKSVLGGKKAEVGSEWVFKIVHIYDDEIEWEYATGEEKDNKKSAMSESMDDMDKMAAPKGY